MDIHAPVGSTPRRVVIAGDGLAVGGMANGERFGTPTSQRSARALFCA